MSTNTVHPTASAVNPPFPLLAPPDPATVIVNYATKNDMSFADVLASIYASAAIDPMMSQWRRDLLAAAERLAATERADEQRKLAEYRRAQSSYSRAHVCRQCHKTDCGHMRRGGR